MINPFTNTDPNTSNPFTNTDPIKENPFSGNAVAPNPKTAMDRSRGVMTASIDLGVPVNQIESVYDSLVQTTPLGVEDPTEMPPSGTYEVKPTLSGQVVGGSLELIKALSQLPPTLFRLMSNSVVTAMPTVGKSPAVLDIPGVTRPMGEPQNNPAYKTLQATSKAVSTGVDLLIESHPDWQADPPDSVKDIFQNPSKFVNSLARAVPLLAGAGFSMAAGSPSTAVLIMFAAEKTSAKEDFMNRGVSEEMAEQGSNIYGSVAAALEFIQVNQGLKLFSGMRSSILHRAATKLAAAKSITATLAKTAVLESVEEMGQGTWQEIVGSALGLEVQGGVGGFVDRRAQEAMFATALTLATGGLGKGIEVTSSQISKFTESLESRKAEITDAIGNGDIQTADNLMNEALQESIVEVPEGAVLAGVEATPTENMIPRTDTVYQKDGTPPPDFPVGTTRIGTDGKIDTMTEVPLDQIKLTEGNRIYAETVNKYKTEPGLPVQLIPENGVLTVDDGHHRIEAAKQLGQTTIKAWVRQESLAPQATPETPSLSPKQISKIMQYTDDNLSQEKRDRSPDEWGTLKDVIRGLKNEGVTYVDAYHVTNADINTLKLEGIKGSEVSAIGTSNGARESSVYMFLDPEDISSGFPGILGTTGPEAESNVVHVKIPVDKLMSVWNDSNFNLTYETYSAVQFLGDVPSSWIESTPQATPEAGVKQPWEMTKSEFAQERPQVEGYRFHGSPEGDLEVIDPYYHTQTWQEGIGFYTTESQEAAKGYAAGRTAKGERKVASSDKGRVNYIKGEPKKPMDMDAPIDTNLWNKIAKLNDYEDFDWSGVKTNRDAYVALITEYNADNMTGEGSYAIEETITGLGYDAFQHTEGVKSGKPHKVTIFRDENSLPSIVKPEDVHRQVIEQALSEGKTVPAEVLAEYPDLKPTVSGTPITPPVPPITTPEAVQPGEDPIQQISKALKAARKVRPLTEAAQKAARKQRVAAAASTMERNISKGDPAEVSIFRSTGLLKGELTNYNQVFEPIRDSINAVNPDAIDQAFMSIADNPDMQYFTKLDTSSAFRKLIDGQSLTYREADLLEGHFGLEIGMDAKERVGASPLADKLINLWRAGLLTGIKTSGLNLYSNFFHGLTETGKDIPAVAVDSMASLFTGERTIGLTARGVPSGMVEGSAKGWNYLRTGEDERNIGEKLDYNRTNFGSSPLAKGLQAYEEFVFHIMGAGDQPFYYGAKARSLYSQAIAQSKNKNLKGAEQQAFIQNLVSNPTDEMLEYAVHDAQVAVFQNKTGIGDWAKLIQQGQIAGLPVGQLVVPFSRTPGAVATQIINYTPVGTVGEIFTQAQKGEFDQRKFSQAVGRSAFGVGVFAVGAALYKAGRIALDRPKSERERELWDAEGRKPNSILINGKWRGLNVLGPAGSVLGIGGHFQRNFDETGSPTKAMVAAASGGAKSFSEQTFVTGANRAMQAISDPERGFETYFTSLAGSMVPTLIADIARATDTTERRSQSAVERIKSRIPGARETLEPRINAYGQDLPRYGGNTLEIMIDPTRPSVVRQDIVVDEMRRLWDADVKVTPTLLGDRDGYTSLTPEENTVLWRRAGDLVHTAIFSVITHKPGDELQGQVIQEEYGPLPDDVKGKIIEKLVTSAQNHARAEAALHKLSQGTLLEDLETSGLVTTPVKKVMTTLGATK